MKKKLSKKKKCPEPDGFTDELYQTLKKNNAILLKLLKKNEEEWTRPNFYKMSITVTVKPYKGSTRKLQTNILDEYKHKNCHLYINKLS